MRRILPAFVFLLVLAIAWWIWPRGAQLIPAPAAAKKTADATSSGRGVVDEQRGPGGSTPQPASTAASAAAPLSQAALEENFPIVAPLNRPNSTVARDLDTVSNVLDAWRTNFPRDGNPVGENADITAVLTGENILGLALIPKTHPAINARGELCDRWGTPFRFHQLSGTRMEIRSAGPDRKFATGDDTVYNPPP
ncbi:MAG: hypothetical protein V4773_20365 [Verrucomicrobiota bacterium]